MINNITIDWNKYVDHIYMIDYTKTKNDRTFMTNELKRLGIYDIDLLTIMMNISTPFYETLHKYFNNDDNEEHISLKENPFYSVGYAFDATIAHYFCIKQAYELGYDHIMILENDICFLRNKQYIKNILDSCYSLYDEYDVFVLDNNVILDKNSKNIQINYLIYNNLINKSNTIYEYDMNDDYTLGMAGCNIYNRVAMAKIINYYESYTYTTIDEYGYIFKKCAYSFPVIGIQQKSIFWYDNDIMELYSIPKFDYTFILKEYCKSCDPIENTIFAKPNYSYNYLKNGYIYIKKYCIGYQNDEDFKYFEKLYYKCILGQDVSFEDIDIDKLNIFILDKETPNKILNSKNYKDVLKEFYNSISKSDIISDWDDNTIDKFYKFAGNKIKECYEYIKENCNYYENDEDFKFFEKLYDMKILGQNVSFDDIDNDKLDIFKNEMTSYITL